MKKYLVTIGFGLLVSSNTLFASSLNSTYLFKLSNQEVLHNNTKIRSFEDLKEEQQQIKEIIVKYNILEEALTGFEEKFVINKAKQEFMNKYLINKTDLLLINTKINQEIDIKNNPKNNIKIFNSSLK